MISISREPLLCGPREFPPQRASRAELEGGGGGERWQAVWAGAAGAAELVRAVCGAMVCGVSAAAGPRTECRD